MLTTCPVVTVTIAVLAMAVYKMKSLDYIRRQRSLIACLLAVTVIFMILWVIYYTNGSYLTLSNDETDPRISADRQFIKQGSVEIAEKNVFYGIMFDAGSTGSRIHVYKFKRSSDKGVFQLLDELFEQTKPGLSSYKDDPVKAAKSLQPMMEKAMKYIPSTSHRDTSIGLKATAGLRLLSNSTAIAILDEVTKLFKSYPFMMSADSVSILEGVEEGLYSWFTVNFLQGSFVNETGGMVGVLDLGGGSTQITYLPSAGSTLPAPPGYEVGVKLFQKKYRLYTHSYLGLGMNSGRFQTLGGKESGENMTAGRFSSSCFPDAYDGSWSHAGQKHSVRHAKVPGTIGSKFETCYRAVKEVIDGYKMHKIPEIQKHSFFAISYYYDKASDSELIDSKLGGTVQVDQFFKAAQTACETVKNDSKEPFSCLDLSYISSLLTDGFGFDKSSRLILKKQINRVEIAWPLGAMFHVYGHFDKLPS